MIVRDRPLCTRVKRARSSEEVQIGRAAATEAPGGQAIPAAYRQGPSNLESDDTWSVDHVVPAVTQSDPLDESELVVPIHIAEATRALVACSSVELDQHAVGVVADIADVWQAVPAPLSIPAGQSVRSFHLMDELHLQWRLCACSHVAQDVDEQLPMLVAAALVHGLE
jgi:hypothetical protein